MNRQRLSHQTSERGVEGASSDRPALAQRPVQNSFNVHAPWSGLEILVQPHIDIEGEPHAGWNKGRPCGFNLRMCLGGFRPARPSASFSDLQHTLKWRATVQVKTLLWKTPMGLRCSLANPCQEDGEAGQSPCHYRFKMKGENQVNCAALLVSLTLSILCLTKFLYR